MSLPRLQDSEKTRLQSQLEKLIAFYRRNPGLWVTLHELSWQTGASEAGASAQLWREWNALHDALRKSEAEVAQLRADGQRLEERIKTARKFVLSAVGNLAEQNWEMCETELGAVLAALTTSDLGRDAP